MNQDGFEILAELRRKAPRLPRLVALMAYVAANDRDRASAAGFDG